MGSTKSHIKSVKKWAEKNKGVISKTRNKSVARLFLNNQASKEDIREFKSILKNRETYLDSSKRKLRMLEPIFEDFQEKHFFRSFLLNNKSELIQNRELQHLWEDFKKVKGDPISLVINNIDIYDLSETSAISNFQKDFKIPEEKIKKIENILENRLTISN